MPAVLAALVYTLSPYLILDIFVRNAFPEFMAISLMPAVFWAADKVIDKAKIIYSLLLSLFLGIALFSHLPTVIIFLPIFLGYCLFILFLNQNTSQLAAGMNGSQKNLPEGILRSLLRSSSFRSVITSMLLDTNILIYAINADSPKNKEAQKFLESPTSRLEITHQNILEAIRVLTHLKYSHPMKLQDALSAISEITIHLEIVTPNKTSYYLALELIKKHQL